MFTSSSKPPHQYDDFSLGKNLCRKREDINKTNDLI